ncbi:PH domain-containing protein [Rhodococcus sp. NPDC003318]|uniref:PH domain-containing protein n=1 Tax=Rhodococcus sp. NPDC003318 TaxID=3364503 RepID=UPI0036C2FBF9
MPPSPSSHTAESPRQSIQISSLGLLGVFLLAFGLSFVIFPSPPWVSVLWIVPVGVAYWMLRVRTVVDTNGLYVRRMFSSEAISWDEVKGFRFPGNRWARAELTDGTEKTLPVVTFGRLPQIAAASGGRVTDPYAVADRVERERAAQDRADATRQAGDHAEPEPTTDSDPDAR